MSLPTPPKLLMLIKINIMLYEISTDCGEDVMTKKLT